LKTILSLFDYTGNWSAPYRRNGYNVIQQDVKLGFDIFKDTLPQCIYASIEGATVHGVLAAVPCTDFASSGARWWSAKQNQPADYDGPCEFKNRIDMSVGMVIATLTIIEFLNPKWWCIENPIGRIRKLVPEIGESKLIFDPCDYGDPYTKRTCLYGDFNPNLPKNPVLPVYGSMMHRMSSTWKTQRSETPKGFACSFFKANP
jgi:hypothetical protein